MKRYAALFLLFYHCFCYAIYNETPTTAISNVQINNQYLVLSIWNNVHQFAIESANCKITAGSPVLSFESSSQISSSGVIATNPVLCLEPETATAATVWIQLNTVQGVEVKNVYGAFFTGSQWVGGSATNPTLLSQTDVPRDAVIDDISITSTLVDGTSNVIWVVTWSEVRNDTGDRVISSITGTYSSSTFNWTLPSVQLPTMG